MKTVIEKSSLTPQRMRASPLSAFFNSAARRFCVHFECIWYWLLSGRNDTTDVSGTLSWEAKTVDVMIPTTTIPRQIQRNLWRML